jgi:hypothetical protein
MILAGAVARHVAKAHFTVFAEIRAKAAGRGIERNQARVQRGFEKTAFRYRGFTRLFYGR